MSAYRVRQATLGDAETLVHHRVAMFRDMAVAIDAAAVEEAFGRWLRTAMASGAYRAWVVEAQTHGIVAGGGVTVIPWPPGPRYLAGCVGFVYNVYTEPAHRRRGLARLIMDAIHAWGRDAGVTAFALNTSADGRPLYESLGYGQTPYPMMFSVLPSAPEATE
jgi:GNAT superfamily N-acetyltransferase